MSLENHPNFHAVKFAVDITVSYYESLRIPIKDLDFATESAVQFEVLQFVETIEFLIDKTQ